MSFQITSLPTRRFLGIKVATSMENAQQDCPKLWEAFAPRIQKELAPLEGLSLTGDSYGLSIMTSEKTFDYWAVVEVQQDFPEKDFPSEMHSITLPERSYVGIETTLAEICNAYQNLYMEWPSSQTEYELDMMAASLEHYSADFSHEKPFMIYAPIKKRA